MKLFACMVLLLLAAAPAAAQETRAAIPGAPPPPARIADLAWLTGIWEGQGISGPARGVYLQPMGGQIAGHFTQARGDGIWFYELITIVEENGSLAYRLRHFNADLTGWEERDVVRSFPLVAVENGAWYFDGLTIRRDGPDGMVGAVMIAGSNGAQPREAVFHYRRTR
jgi:hypothetical protein